jgi:hypothetical protein
MAVPYFYDKQIRRYIQQFIRLFSGFSVQMGVSDQQMPVFQQVPVRYGDINRMAAHITRENSENIVNTVPFISCYVTELSIAPERRVHQQHVEKVQVYEKKVDDTTGKYLNEVGNTYSIERYMPVPYNLTMNVDVWTSNTDQKLQLFEQIGILFNPSLNIRATNNPFDWSSLAYVENTNIVWSSRSVGSNIDDIIDVMTLTYTMPILINPPAKVKHQKLIHTVINQLYNLTDEDLDAFKNNEPFDNSSLQYTVVTLEDRKLRYENGKAYLLASNGSNIDPGDGVILKWNKELTPFGELREGISQLRLRKSNDPGNNDNDIIGRLSYDSIDENALVVDIDTDTLPTDTLAPINAVINPAVNYPGDGVVPLALLGQRYLITQDVPVTINWTNIDAHVNDIIEFNGTNWIVSFDSSIVDTQQFVTNIASEDQLEWDGTDWFNSYEGVYKAGYWRLYL